MKLALALAASLLLIGCELPPPPPPPPAKVVVLKKEVVESRISAWDTMTKKGVTTKSQTVYYLIASDGTVCEVGLSEFVVTKEGSTKSCEWEVKQ
jgi:hypothetical protein